MPYKAAIIGCGRIASTLDDDPLRPGIWTHAGAYNAVEGVQLMAACDIDADKREDFSDKWLIETYADYKDMLAFEDLDIVSICTPPQIRHDLIISAISMGVRAIFCEKPIANTAVEAERIIETCNAAEIVFAVNHTRRWDKVFNFLKLSLALNRLGKIKAVRAIYTGGVVTVGTHLFDLLCWYLGNCIDIKLTGGSTDKQDPDLSCSLMFENGVECQVLALDQDNYFMFELDILGSKGRARVDSKGCIVEFWHAADSKRYTGYRELIQASPSPTHQPHENSRMVAAVKDLLNCIETGNQPSCTGEDGLNALRIAESLLCQN